MTTATASKETAGPKRGRQPDLRLVDHGRSAGDIVANTAPPVAMMVPAVDPLSEYRAFESLRKMDAQGELDLLDAREHRALQASRDRLAGASADCEAEIEAAVAKRDRRGEMERQHRDAEHSEYLRHRSQYEMIVNGAEASLEATDPPAEIEAQATD